MKVSVSSNSASVSQSSNTSRIVVREQVGGASLTVTSAAGAYLSIIETGNGLYGGPITSTTGHIISANSANTTQPGIVQLNDTTISSSITQAATANAVRKTYTQANNAYNQANSAYNEANTRLSTSGGTITGDLNLQGNLFISGTSSYINVTSVTTNDSIIILSSNSVGDVVDIGFVGHYSNAGNRHTGLIRHAADDTFYLFENYPIEPTNNIIDVTNTDFRLATLRANINAASLTINGVNVATQANLTLAYNQANSAYTQANNAYTQANLAYTTANSAVNTVMISADSGSTLVGKQLNFNNTSSIIVNLSTGTGSNANVSFATVNATSNKYTTSGSANTFTLNSSVANNNNILVSIDGVVIVPSDDYTVSGTTLTLTFMPPAGLIVEARKLA